MNLINKAFLELRILFLVLILFSFENAEGSIIIKWSVTSEGGGQVLIFLQLI